MTRRGAWASALGLVACLSILAAGAVPAAADNVIAPGQEQLLAAMMGRGEMLPGSCTFSAGQVESTLVRSTFECPAGAVVIELRHASAGAGAAVTTQRFALAVASGSPPAELIEALAARVREREAEFVWIAPGKPARVEPASPVDFIELDARFLQGAWVILILASPFLCWRGGRAVGVAGARAILAVTLSIGLAVAATWSRGDEPLHANGHAWREAREVLAPWGERSTGGQPFLHGQGSMALQRLLAAFEIRLSGAANPLHISRWAGAAAAGAAALLALVLTRSWWAGVAAGGVLALMPLAQMLAVSGSPLAIAAWILPWTLALLIAAGVSGDRWLLGGAALAAALGTLSHTAMLAWPPALLVAWLVVARGRLSLAAIGAFLLIGLALFVQLSNVLDMVSSRNQGPSGGLLAEAWRGVVHRNLLLDARWASPLMLPMAVLWVVGGLWRRHTAVMLASVVALAVVAAPFFAVTQCSSDAVRYQGALLGLVTALAVAGVWSLPFAERLGAVGVTLLRAVLPAAMVLLPTAPQRQPLDPVAFEHELVADAVGRLEPGTLVILPKGRFDHGRVIPDFPDFLLPENARVAFEGDPRIHRHRGRRVVYLGLACISYGDDDTAAPAAMRPECQGLRRRAEPWMVRTLRDEDLPRAHNGEAWTFHRLATGVPFGFFDLERAEGE